MQPILRLAIVNRGEAAMRCIRTVKSLRTLECSEMQALALYTEVDREAPYVRHADLAGRLPARATPVASYLDQELLLDTLKKHGADAVWPGWGFVAESPEFVDRLSAVGIRFLGPSGDTMRELGDKIASKLLAERLSVPVTVWSGGVVDDVEGALQAAEHIGLPLVIKASAGGGGRGIRMVEDLARLPALFASARAEALSAFGDGRLFLERMVRGGRHIEVQIVADQHGTVRALGCRDCSVQRRHQKVIEEAPPIGLPRELLDALEQSAERLAREVRYSGVGTVEFLVEPGGAFYFMEMNPRLQVEHGITEEITGLDLVELQIRIARGEHLDGLVPTEHGYCIEARVCAEDPDAGFLPAPGRIARFDPAFGPHIRIDTGVATDSSVPAAFDSLIAKVMARGATREQARSRLWAALGDFDLVIQGGVTNKGYLLELLNSEAYRQGGVDTLWLDRWSAERRSPRHAREALALAGVLAYRTIWRNEREQFFADPGTITSDKIPATQGKKLELEYLGESYLLSVFAVSASSYRIQCDGLEISARFGQTGSHSARVVIAGRYYRATYDITDATIRVEVEGCVHRFGRQTVGQVRASAPSLVVAIDVSPGQRVEVGQHLGLLEAMKMEIGFLAPVAGTVTEVCASRGQQVAAGDLLLVIDAASEPTLAKSGHERLRLPEVEDPLTFWFGSRTGSAPAIPDLQLLQRTPDGQRARALAAINAEVESTMLGWDVHEPQLERVLALLEAPLPNELSPELGYELSAVRHSLSAFVDLEQLFSQDRQIDERGTLGSSNNAQLRSYLRRMRGKRADLNPNFLATLQAALRHYGVDSTEHSEDLERALLRMFAAQKDPTHRRRLAMAVLRRLISILNAGTSLASDLTLRDSLLRIAALRGELSNALADTALEAHYRAHQGGDIAREGEHTTRSVESWLGAQDPGQVRVPPSEMLEALAIAPGEVWGRIRTWLSSPDPGTRLIALSAYIRRLYAPQKPQAYRAELVQGAALERLRYEGKLVLAVLTTPNELGATLRGLGERQLGADVWAMELIVTQSSDHSPAALLECIQGELGSAAFPERVTLSLPTANGDLHHTLKRDNGLLRPQELHGLHPEVATRVELARYCNFELERLWSPEDVYCFYARARQNPADERVFVMAEVRARPSAEANEDELLAGHFERQVQEAARALRLNLGIRDPRRQLHWNRLSMYVAYPVLVNAAIAQRVARRLHSDVRHLGLEKTVVRLRIESADHPGAVPREIEVVGADLASSRLELTWRRPHREPLVPASAEERKMVEARRRGLTNPYEIVRMLSSGKAAPERNMDQSPGSDRRPPLPAGHFEEYDLAPESATPLAASVANRAPGANSSAIVFGLITTPTAKVPEGMRRVLILSDPTRGMGALAPAECDRIVAAIDLAERLSLPVEWLPISSGARIAMDSGTENLDATARVVRRIVTFTQTGGVIHLLIVGINVGAQSYWNALATMLMHTKGALIMTPGASMVLTGSAALAASGSVSAENEVTIGGHERVMGPNGQAQYFASDILGAYQLLYAHHEYTYVVPGERAPRKFESRDPSDRDLRDSPYLASTAPNAGQDFQRIGNLFDEGKNPGRKRPFSMRAVMRGLIDEDGGQLERWTSHADAETAIVWDAHLGGHPISLLGIEGHNVPRLGYRPSDGPEEWNGGTLFPQSSKKVARALNAASGNRPVVVLANLSGFDGSPEAMRRLQLEYGAEIARAVVNFKGSLVFLVISRYHGGAYVVFSRELNPGLRSFAVEGSYASVIGGGPAATVVFAREVRARVAADPRVEALRAGLRDTPNPEARAAFDRLRKEVTLEKRAEIAAEFDAIHTVERAARVGSLEGIIGAREIRPRLIELLNHARADALL